MAVSILNLAEDLLTIATSLNPNYNESVVINDYVDLINSLLYELGNSNSSQNQIKREICSAMIFLIKKLERFGYSNVQIQNIKNNIINLKFPNINMIPDDYEHDINVACLKGLYSSVQYAVEHDNADPNNLQVGYTALQHACLSGSLNIMEYLIEKCDANIDVVDEHGFTLLFLAIFGGHIHVIRYLLKFVHVNKHATDMHGRDPLTFAMQTAPQNVYLYLMNDPDFATPSNQSSNY